ncbi:MAG: Imm27 family immunity protein [bacterium]
METYEELGPHEQRLDGAWVVTPEGTIGDEVDRRIFWLVRYRLWPRGAAHGGWDQLYLDPRDGRLWELTFPHGSLHGGGPRRLTHMPREVAAAKYGSVE